MAANLNKKFSELKPGKKKKLKEKYGSIKAARAAHSKKREAAGLKKSDPVRTQSLQINPDTEPVKLSNFVGPLQTGDDGNKILPPGVIDDLGITRGNDGGPGGDLDLGGKFPTADELAAAIAKALARKDEPDDTATMGEYQNIDDGQTLGLKPGEQIKNVLSGLTIDKNIYKKAFYKKKGELGPLTKKLNQYKDFYDKNSKNTIKVDGKKKNYLQLLKDKATQRMKIDPSKYGRRDKAEYESIKDKLDKGKGMQMFNDLSLAEKYDVSKKTLFKQLQKPLNKVITEKLDDRLSNFKIGKKGEVKGIKFNQQKFDEYSKAGPGISDRVVDAAKALGVRDIAGVSGSSGRMKRIKNISDRVKSKAQTKRSTSSDYKKQFGQELQYQPLEYI